ncbi:ribosomal protein S5 domain 2-type protein [Chytriomyces cf. hyalinus JEL632]|nr:ribosomal protein S5 domain 2-type protein [Chytriomyces cf. hyalinus JEL632]
MPPTSKRSSTANHARNAGNKKPSKRQRQRKVEKPSPTRISVAKAPAKLIVFGEHAVVYPQIRAVAAAIDLKTTVTIRDGVNVLGVSLPDVGLPNLDIPIELLGPAADMARKLDHLTIAKDVALIEALEAVLTACETGSKPIPYFARRAVLSLLVLYLGISKGRSPSLNIKTDSEIPPGSGLGSSASFCVALAASLLLHCGAIDTIQSHDGDRVQKDLELVNAWAYVGETVLHGTVSGVDNSVVCFGGANIYVKGQPLKSIDGFPPLRMILTNTGVEKDTKKQVGIVTHRMTTIKSVTEKLVSAVDAISGECCDLLSEFGKSAITMDELCNKLDTLIQMNHGILTALGVSHPTLENIVNITAKHGLSTKLTGAGGGGCSLTLVPEGCQKAAVDAVRELTEAGFECFERRVGCEGVVAGFEEDG